MNHDNYSIHKLGPKFKHFLYNALRWVFSLPVPPNLTSFPSKLTIHMVDDNTVEKLTTSSQES